MLLWEGITYEWRTEVRDDEGRTDGVECDVVLLVQYRASTAY